MHEKSWRKCNYKKKVNVKKHYRKIRKKKDNDVDANVAQCEYSNIKRYASAFSNI